MAEKNPVHPEPKAAHPVYAKTNKVLISALQDTFHVLPACIVYIRLSIRHMKACKQHIKVTLHHIMSCERRILA